MTAPGLREVASARNKALRAAGWDNVSMPRGEWEREEYCPLRRKEALCGNSIHFTPHDKAMVFCVLAKPFEHPEPRPWRIMVGTETATDKRGRARRWGSSQSALAEARRIERDALGIPRRRRVGAKREPAPPGELLTLMGA